VHLGKPYSGEINNYHSEYQQGITIWYTFRIGPVYPEEPIIIEIQRSFLGSWLTISGAKLNMV